MRWLRSGSRPRGVILVYHRISELPTDPNALCVTPEHLDEQLQVLRRVATPIPLFQLARGVEERIFPHRSVALTFDDGYADNLTNAKPLLERHEIAATVFVPGGRSTREREFWWDELERVFLQPGILPQHLELPIGGTTERWDLGEYARYDEGTYERHRRWTVLERSDPTMRQHIYRVLSERIKSLPAEKQHRCLDALLTWAGIQPILRPSHRTLSREEAIRLADGELIEIGAHTMTHPVLRTLPPEAQWSELQESKAYLENLLGRTVVSFAYPYGSVDSYTKQTVTLVRQAGFTFACSNIFDVVWPGSDPFQLPRVTVPDLDGDAFGAFLEKWFHV